MRVIIFKNGYTTPLSILSVDNPVYQDENVDNEYLNMSIDSECFEDCLKAIPEKNRQAIRNHNMTPVTLSAAQLDRLKALSAT